MAIFNGKLLVITRGYHSPRIWYVWPSLVGVRKTSRPQTLDARGVRAVERTFRAIAMPYGCIKLSSAGEEADIHRDYDILSQLSPQLKVCVEPKKCCD